MNGPGAMGVGVVLGVLFGAGLRLPYMKGRGASP